MKSYAGKRFPMSVSDLSLALPCPISNVGWSLSLTTDDDDDDDGDNDDDNDDDDGADNDDDDNGNDCLSHLSHF